MIDDETSMFAFKCPKFLREALTEAAKADYRSKSDVARQAIIQVLSERGLMAKPAEVVEA
jgi:metal-responsive CopG/Arc/MetJ family transcriptional regulator